jgi:hypothetical protein
MFLTFSYFRNICLKIHHSQILQILLKLQLLSFCKILTLNSLILFLLFNHPKTCLLELLGFSLCLCLSCCCLFLLFSNLSLYLLSSRSYLLINWSMNNNLMPASTSTHFQYKKYSNKYTD